MLENLDAIRPDQATMQANAAVWRWDIHEEMLENLDAI